MVMKPCPACANKSQVSDKAANAQLVNPDNTGTYNDKRDNQYNHATTEPLVNLLTNGESSHVAASRPTPGGGDHLEGGVENNSPGPIPQNIPTKIPKKRGRPPKK